MCQGRPPYGVRGWPPSCLNSREAGRGRSAAPDFHPRHGSRHGSCYTRLRLRPPARRRAESTKARTMRTIMSREKNHPIAKSYVLFADNGGLPRIEQERVCSWYLSSCERVTQLYLYSPFHNPNFPLRNVLTLADRFARLRLRNQPSNRSQRNAPHFLHTIRVPGRCARKGRRRSGCAVSFS